MKYKRVNIKCPITGKCIIGYARKYTDISWIVKTIKGVFEVLTEDITFFSETYHLTFKTEL